ncbi:3-oxoacyl-ACP reductase FabG [Thermoplasmatales archaeon AK]|nr:3-oxoacyl-ACP reductase FabG [Thermoplasmatales archaeon AK]
MSGPKTVVITGGAGGIGTAIGRQLAEEGYRIILGDLRAEVSEVANELRKETSGDVLGYTVDVADAGSVSKFFENIFKSDIDIDILINNAGITRDTTFRKMTFDQWDIVIKVNLYGAYHCTKMVIDGMIRRGFGRIVNISSISRYGNIGQANYAASKAGLVGLTLTLAKELARYGITVNAISPGLIETEMVKAIPEQVMANMLKRIPSGRLGRPDEIASLVSFLLSERAQYINGEIINVNGGFFF